ncbi:MAG TPA: PQQ-binding-like beta-propeller repeat protein, partial [Polyangiaceae bacterium]|nr:PQQ-binding-like beta-propeller repeat protein [Polyangiaceae bacterium]
RLRRGFGIVALGVAGCGRAAAPTAPGAASAAGEFGLVAGAPVVTERTVLIGSDFEAGARGDGARTGAEITALEPAAVAWRFSAGSPTPGVVVGRDGTVYVPTHEGHVEALSAEGGLRWAYNVQTPAVGAVVTPDGVLVVGTQEGRLHALRPDGTRLWSLQAPFPITTDLVPGAHCFTLFGDRSGAVVAVDGFGAVRGRWPISEPFGAPPVALPGGGVAALGAEGRLFWLGAGPQRSLVLGSAPGSELMAGAGGDLLALAGSALVVVRDGAVVLRLPGVVGAVARGDGFVTVGPEPVLAFRSRAGEVVVEHPLVAPPSAAPVVDSGGVVHVATTTGALVVATTAGVRAWQVAARALLRPLLDPARGRVILASGDGSVVAVAAAGLSP